MTCSMTGDDLRLDEGALQYAFGTDPRPDLQQVLAVVAAALEIGRAHV